MTILLVFPCSLIVRRDKPFGSVQASDKVETNIYCATTDKTYNHAADIVDKTRKDDKVEKQHNLKFHRDKKMTTDP